MPDANEPEEQSHPIYRPIPELHDPQGMAITSEVEALLHTVMQRTQVATERFQQFVERFGRRNDPVFLLERKKQFLAALLRESKDMSLPEAFFSPLLRIAVYEANPSFNRGFIEPCCHLS